MPRSKVLSTNRPKTRLHRLPPRQPRLRFSPTAWAKLLFLRDAGPTEVGGFGISAADDLLLIEDVVLVRQHCSVITVAFEDSAVAEFFDAQIDAGRRPEQFGRIWIHTHPGDSPQPSSVDEDTFARVFGRSDWAVMAILACGGASYARLRFSTGPGGEQRIPVEIDYRGPFAATDHAAWQAEYDICVQPLPDLLASTSRSISDSLRETFGQRELTPLELAAWPEW